MSLETEDLFALIRSELSDPEYPGSGDDSDSLWTNEEIAQYLDEAQREFASATLCLPDATTFTGITVTAGDPWVVIDPRIVEIRYATLVTAKREVEPTTLVTIKRENTNWSDNTGTPAAIITDIEAGKGRLFPIPTADDTMDLIVYREPLEEIEDVSADLEIDNKFRRTLIHRVCALAYLKDDAETYNPTNSQNRMTQWFSKLEEAKAFYKKKTRRFGVTTYGGIL